MLLLCACRLVFPEASRSDAPPRPAFELRQVLSVKLSSSWRNLTNAATVELPTRLLFHNQKILVKDWLQRGDALTIDLGYNLNVVREFTGYIADVKPGYPVTLTCEDAMYLLKRHPVKCSYAGVTLRQLLHDICPKGTVIDAADVSLGQFRAANVTVAKVLQKLREQYGFVSYFRDGTLFCGKVYHEPRPKEPTAFSLERDVLTDGLEYRRASNLRVIVEATSRESKGKDLKVTVGDVTALDAERRALLYYNVHSEEALRTFALADLRKTKVEGYKGSFTTYGAPSMRHGQVARLTSLQYPERDGDFFIDAVTKTFASDGYQQEITLGSQAALDGLT
ncbi:hypothetical protein [Hymenobacter sp. IS2118]|uniref:hypothetical protein n=1 Tax=Hymenobacter sp. IS2118 TaxID=1505605 RepID=UPI0005525AA3|nr:hypothetical protein [Hymenobacter sp. IS2118]